MKKGILGLFLLLFSSEAVFGTELELSNLRDPFDFGREGIAKGTTSSKQRTRLGMVVDMGGNLVAYIDSVPHKVGDVIDGAKITAITLAYVELVSHKKTWRMYVEPNKGED